MIAVSGATGRTGSLIVEQALAKGHEVRALTRTDSHQDDRKNVTWVSGSIDDVKSLQSFIGQSEVVISALGPRPPRMDVCSVATANLIQAGAPRLIVVSGMGLSLPGDRKSLVDKAVAQMQAFIAKPTV